jgi:CMP-N,N'-diacetyllegionaminic acid synthase
MLNNKSILVIVPARGGSKGVKLKNIQPLRGVPLVALVGRVVQQLPYVDRAVVSTDHPEIARIARESGLAAPFVRPQELSGDIVSDFEVLHHALLAMEGIDQKKYDVILMLQPTCPLRRPEHVTACLDKLLEGHFDSVWTVSPTDSKHHPLKQLTLTDDCLDYYDAAGAKIIARQQLSTVYHRNGAAYAITRACLVDQKSIKGAKAGGVIIPELLISIDTDFDFKLCEFILESYYHGRTDG